MFFTSKRPDLSKTSVCGLGNSSSQVQQEIIQPKHAAESTLFLKRSIRGFMAQIFAFLDPNLGWTRFSQPFLQQNRKPLDRQNVSWLFHEDTDSAHCGNSQAFLLKGKHVVLGSFYSEIPVLRHTIKGSNFMFKILTDVSDVGFVETKWSQVMVLWEHKGRKNQICLYKWCKYLDIIFFPIIVWSSCSSCSSWLCCELTWKQRSDIGHCM